MKRLLRLKKQSQPPTHQSFIRRLSAHDKIPWSCADSGLFLIVAFPRAKERRMETQQSTIQSKERRRGVKEKRRRGGEEKTYKGEEVKRRW